MKKRLANNDFFFFNGKKFEVKKIHTKDTKDFILNKHYAKRMSSISYTFGLFISDNLEGVLTIGKPASNSLCKGICGEEYSKKVYERYVYFTGKSRKKLLKKLNYKIENTYPKIPYSKYKLGSN